jgi:transposase
MDPALAQEIQALTQQGLSIRAIAKKLGIDRKTVRRTLARDPAKPSPSKLEPFKEKVRLLLSHGLTGPRILREIRELGYTGGRTILGEFLREHRGPKKEPRKAFRRFETARAAEAQADWSPYRVWIAGVQTTANCFSLILAHSRRIFVAFYRDQRLPSLLHAHVEAFRYMEGVTRTVLYDNMTQVTLGRRGGQPIWNEKFLEFSKHYGFEPRVCRPRDPNRRGKGERPFAWIYTELIVGNTFSSWEDLNSRARTWLDTVANVRLHSTTRRRVDEMFAEEKPLLIALPSLDYPTDRREVRKVGIDGTVALDGSYFPVPARFVGQHVVVRVYPDHVEILDAQGQVAARHRIPERPTRIFADGTPPAAIGPAPLSRTAMETAFLARFPEASDFLDGLHARMKALLPIHLRQIDRLVEVYRQNEVAAAIHRAQRYRNFSALAVARILERAHPNVVGPLPLWAGSNPAALGALDDVDAASPKDYTIDTAPPTPEAPHE